MPELAKPSTPTNLPEFLADRYTSSAAGDVAPRDRSLLERRAVEHHETGRRRLPNETLLRIFPEEDGSVVLVVTDDVPFLVDSVTAELSRRGLGIGTVTHLTMLVSRDNRGLILGTGEPGHATPQAIEPNGDMTSVTESWMAVEIQGPPGTEDALDLVPALGRILDDVRAAFEDWPLMQEKAALVAARLGTSLQPVQSDEDRCAQELFTWLTAGHFVFLGYCEYDLVRQDDVDVPTPRPGAGLGILRLESGARPAQRTENLRAKVHEKRLLVITKTDSHSTVHRNAFLDDIGVKTFDSAGHVTGELRFLGLFTGSVYNGSVLDVPIVRDKIQAVMTASRFDPNSHSGRDLMSVLTTYPLDELLQIDADDLTAKAMGIIGIQERRRTRVFLRTDVSGRFVTALVYLPRERYNTSVRTRVESELKRIFGATDVDFEARVTTSALARIFFTLRLPQDSAPVTVQESELESRLALAARSWLEGVQAVVQASQDCDDADQLVTRWGESFPPEYRVKYTVEEALEDILRLDRLSRDRSLSATQLYVHQYQVRRGQPATRIKLYLRQPRSLTRILPYFEHLGLEVIDERPFEIRTSDEQDFYLYDLSVIYPRGADISGTAELLADSFSATLSGHAESDSMNALVLSHAIRWRDVVMLRTYTKYLRQVGEIYSYEFVAGILNRFPDVADSLVALFHAKFAPRQRDRNQATAIARGQFDTALDGVATLDAARVLQAIGALVEATVRTNFYQDKSHISMKFDPSRLDILPLPRPAHEVWVCSPRVEGVHLRYGKIARGGLRWSDRREDFRTEILGLVKAQAVKNAVIIPEGAKGGFYAKQLPASAERAARLTEGQECYRIFIRGLLDVTDNLIQEGDQSIVVAPLGVVRHDDDDTYLVVAADKGTATFSDIANSVAAEYGYWLGDAFASGGSIGYDHKEMGITARGAWEAVKVHFSELMIDPSSTDFTVAGIGDMSGDVFGNSMLLSRHILLVAAFDHRHIFLDPAPDAATSWGERQRLFTLQRSSWADYNPELISSGGGVWSRESRAIPLNERLRSVLGLPETVASITPPDLLKVILAAPVDLLYNGGIGTYVKATTETNLQVGDRANDSIRVNGAQIRARVVVEGGNLGLTQRGRIEAALNGVLINTDAIDNSAGVDCSDHEVNIKILVDQMIRKGRLTPAERPQFLAGLTKDVADLVLADNVGQNILLRTDRRFPAASSPNYERMMEWLEERQELDREIEGLPSREALRERVANDQGLTSPELCVLSAYAKSTLAQTIARTGLASDPFFASVLGGYFPAALYERSGADVDSHPLRTEIISTVIANDAINIGGVTSMFRLIEETAAEESDAVKAFVVATELFGLKSLIRALIQLPADLPAEQWSHVHLDIRRLLDRAMRWFVHYDHELPIAACVARYKPVIDQLGPRLSEFVQGEDQERLNWIRIKAGEWQLPKSLETAWAEIFEAATLLDIARIRQLTAQPLEVIASVYYTIYDRYGMDELLQLIDRLPRRDKWEALARAALRDDLAAVIPELTISVLALSAAAPEQRIEAWETENHNRLNKLQDLRSQAHEESFEALSTYISILRKAAHR